MSKLRFVERNLSTFSCMYNDSMVTATKFINNFWKRMLSEVFLLSTLLFVADGRLLLGSASRVHVVV
ncbi:hypothetical protein [Candidatus Endolissoclinum faulkneri]|uniref:hypothetical protein n=1 Tax=Candidatus Endolissoclinum faulkneri TaxID=1263979 RepID=UPI001314C172|nr:hypothetical protein [Candidatus Endolissoclinum faulkneri]